MKDIIGSISVIKNFMGNASRTACNEYLYEALTDAVESMEWMAQYENLGVTPEQLKRIDGMYADRCKEIAELKKRLELAEGGRL